MSCHHPPFGWENSQNPPLPPFEIFISSALFYYLFSDDLFHISKEEEYHNDKEDFEIF